MTNRAENIQKVCVLILCLFVCLFFVNAKLSGLQSRLELTSGSDAKDFTAYQKMYGRVGSSAAVLFVSLTTVSFYLTGRERIEQLTPTAQFSPARTGHELYRYLRPPPILL